MSVQVEEQGRELAELMAGKRTLVVAGAGMSTAAGLPDYRGTGSSGVPTVDFDQFMSRKMWRRWVWQRNQETWRAVASLQPTLTHRVVAQMQQAGLVIGLATQNVDGLDEAAGIEHLALLHGTFRRVECVDCSASFNREEIDARLRAANPTVVDDPDPAHVAILAAADEAAARQSTFETVPCELCGGILKPAVVFFNQALPAEQMNQAFAWAAQCDLVLVAGTSLLVGTGLWVVYEALEHGAEVAIVNQGPTQADRFAIWRSHAALDDVFLATWRALGKSGGVA